MITAWVYTFKVRQKSKLRIELDDGEFLRRVIEPPELKRGKYRIIVKKVSK